MATDPLLGQMIGSYRVTEQIGQGGMGRIYLAVQPSIGARVAIKVLAHERTGDMAEIERFFAEARVVNVIRHENIVNVLDLCVLPDGAPCIVMEHLDGAPLSDVIAKRGPLPVKEVCALAQEVLAALAAAHDKGIVHRDLKPENIFVTQGGHAKILDFGIAKLMTRAPGTGPTRAGQIIGSPAYLAPEQIRGSGEVDGRADLYALGLCMFEALTGAHPFTGETAFVLLHAHEHTAPRAPHEVSRDVPRAVGELVLRALAKEPALRFANARDMARALAQASVATTGADEPIPDTVPADQAARNAMTARPRPATRPLVAPPRAATGPLAKERARPAAGLVALGAGAITLLLVAMLAGRRWMHTTPIGSNGDPHENVVAVRDGAHFDASRFLVQATALARARMSDVGLVEIEITPADRKGVIDVTPYAPSSQARYVFSGHRNGKPLAVFVVVTAGEVRTMEGAATLQPLPFPRCSVQQILAVAALPAERAEVTYSRPPQNTSTPWRVAATDGSGSRTLADECTSSATP